MGCASDSDMSNLDPVTLTVIQNGLIQVCNEMDLAFVRAAFSPVISEGMDRSDGIYDATDGALIAQGELGLPVFVGTMQFSTRTVIDRVKSHYAGKLEPGDVFIVNDPYLGGTHLMDVRFVKPFFYKGEVFAWLANTGHWPDVGGMVPGGFSASATEVEQEGLRLPPVKFFKKGEMDQEILSIILSNIRIADQRIGDIKAQAAALTTGEVRLTALIDRYGADIVRAAIAEMRHRAERQMRSKIAGIPDGIYEGTSQVDSDGVVDEPLTIRMKVTKKGETLTFDMTGSSPPCRGPMNSVIATTKSAIYLAIKHIFPDVPINAGTFEPLQIVEPVGTFLYAKYPRPVSGCAAEVSQRIAEAVFAALTHAIPGILFAAPAGTSFVYHSYSLEYRRLSFVAQTAFYPAEVDVLRPRANLQSALDDRAQRLEGGKWSKVDWRDVQGATAVESIGPIAGGSALRQLSLLKGRRFVSLGYLGPADAMRAPEAERFFRSLRLTA